MLGQIERGEVDGGGYFHADAHSAGTQADVPHSYHNPGAQTASISMVIHYPRSG
jgi:hypothetical protein